MKKIYWILLFYVLYSNCVISQQYRSDILKNTTYVRMNNNNLIYLDTTVIRINERMGDHDASDQIYYQKGEKASFGTIFIEDIEGNLIRKLKKNEIKERSSISDFSLYEDRIEQFFKAKHHQYPYILRYSKKQERKRYTNIISLDCSNLNIPIHNGELILEIPIDKQIKQKIHNINSYKIDTVGQTVYHRYSYSHKPQPYKQKYSSVNSKNTPYIIISPIEIKYGINGFNENWETFGKWIFDLNKGKDQLPLEEKAKIEHLLGETENKYEQIKLLYQYLQDNTRYINISTQIGGLQTHSAEYVVNNKYGDCKALTNYMQAMLKAIGIESFYTLINSSDNVYDLDEEFSYNAFNHVILTVPLNNDTLFLECTSKNTPMGYIGTSNQGRKALLIKKNGSKLIHTSQMTPLDVLCTRDFDIYISENGNANVILYARERGEDYEILNAYQEITSRNTVDYFIRENVLDGSFDIEDYQIIKENRDSSYIDLKINSKMSHLYKKQGNNLIISPFPLYIPKFEKPNKRTQDIQLDYPIYKKDKLTIHLNDFKISKIPSNLKIQSRSGDYYTMKYIQEENSIIIEKELFISSKRLSIDEYAEFYLFLNQVKNNEISNYYFEIL